MTLQMLTLVDGRLVQPQDFDGQLREIQNVVSVWVDQAKREPKGLERLTEAISKPLVLNGLQPVA